MVVIVRSNETTEIAHQELTECKSLSPLTYAVVRLVIKNSVLVCGHFIFSSNLQTAELPRRCSPHRASTLAQ